MDWYKSCLFPSSISSMLSDSMKVSSLKIIGIAILISLVLNAGVIQASPPAWQAKVEQTVLAGAANEPVEFLVFLTRQADLSGAAQFTSKVQKGAYVYHQLTQTAARSQGAMLEMLDSQDIPYRPFWIANMVWVEADLDIVQTLAQRQDVARIYANPEVELDLPPQEPIPRSSESSDSGLSVEWNIDRVGAPEVWQDGFTGQGVVIGGQDTGYAWDHPALVVQYRGWDGNTADHNYNWHDAIHEAGSSDCGADAVEPCDDYGHGTHTMGTMVGDDGGENQIGMAPGARWIGCRNMNRGVGSPATYSECYQWFIAPTDLNNENPRPDLAPDVINNSWSCPPGEGCEDPLILLTVVENLRAAGIVTVHSAGNSGYTCSTVDTPAAIYDASFTVGATDGQDNIASFSSRGPVNVDGSGRLKPDISAPGIGIRSSTRDADYGGSSGTSMAGPHVAGLVALLISANPSLRGQVEEIEQIVRRTALPRTTGQNCGDIPGDTVPNHTYGWGRIDAERAYRFATADFFYLPVLQKGY